MKFLLLTIWFGAAMTASGQSAATWPGELPAVNSRVTIPAQEWPLKPGPRSIEILLHYPGGKRKNVNGETGIMQPLHNWGGHRLRRNSQAGSTGKASQCRRNMCGMAKLSDDIAFNEAGGTRLNARWSRNSSDSFYLSPARQQLHFVGNPPHLKVMRDLGNSTRIVVVHGADDHTCPIEDAREMVANFRAAKLDVRSHFISKDDLDGKIFTSSGHLLGNRTEIVFTVAGQWLDPKIPKAQQRKGPFDFECRDTKVRYPVTGGNFVISYEKGYPVGSFEPKDEPPSH